MSDDLVDEKRVGGRKKKRAFAGVVAAHWPTIRNNAVGYYGRLVGGCWTYRVAGNGRGSKGRCEFGIARCERGMVVTVISRIIDIGADMRPSVCRRDHRRRRRNGCECYYTLSAVRRTPRCAEGALRANWRLAVGRGCR